MHHDGIHYFPVDGSQHARPARDEPRVHDDGLLFPDGKKN